VFSAVAMVGCLYHLLNHACFKSLLFFNSGSILLRTGTRDLDRLGGLIKIMPLTAACAIVGALSIAGTPPFNGFISKWLLYQSAIFGDTGAPLYVLYGVVAIFVGSVTLASFIKYLGSAYLGTLPERYARAERGCPKSMEIVELLLAGACFLLGVFPGLVMAVLLKALPPPLLGGPTAAIFTTLPWGGASVSLHGVRVAAAGPLILLTALVVCTAIAYGIYRSVSVASRPAELWNCGELVPDEEVRYRASSFYKPFKDLIGFLYRQNRFPRLSPPRKLLEGLDLDRWVYFPLASLFLRISRGLSRLHNGVPQFYLLWQMVGLVLSIGLIVWIVGGGQ
jgi:NADH:ubiquinone oxidoreductase subunit 5 (subunit L)/multisubunit Na+/H+ antiporter MnhA subunit